MIENYREEGVVCESDTLVIRHYYLWGSKKVAYRSIVDVQRVTMGVMKGRGRIRGTANMGYWTNLDTQRPLKTEGLILDLGTRVKPFITPDDPERVETIIRERAGLGPAGPTISAPII
jgi:hypothetical protein